MAEREIEKNAPSVEDALEAARTLQLVRDHVSGFGMLRLTEKMKRGRGRVLEAQLLIRGSHNRFVKPELLEIVQPAAEILGKAMNAYHWMRIDLEQRSEITLMLRT